MSRPASVQPTPAELEVLKVLWEQGSCSVRQVMEQLNDDRPRAYTSVMSLMVTMAEKGLLNRHPKGRAFIYSAALPRERAQGRMLKDLVKRVFEGSPAALVNQLLDQANPSEEELLEIRKVIESYRSHLPGNDKDTNEGKS